jgi:hypothetical protein
VWPHAAVRGIVEDTISDELERGVANGIYNSRGVVSRALDEGGAQERKLVERYNGYAAALKTQWPRTASMLRRIADFYSHDAAREDAEMELRENLED